MKDKSFDKLLQEKLQGHEYASTGPDWSRMESALNQVDKDIQVDSEIRNRLENHRVPYEPSHWEILKKKLEFEKNLKKRIVTTKIAEVTILLLLIFSVYQLKEYNEGLHPNNIKNATATDLAIENDVSESNDILVSAAESSITNDSQVQVTVDSEIQPKSIPTIGTDRISPAVVQYTTGNNVVSTNAAVASFESSAKQSQTTRLIETSSGQDFNEPKTTSSLIIDQIRGTVQTLSPLGSSASDKQNTTETDNGARPTASLQSKTALINGTSPTASLQSKTADTDILAEKLRSLEEIETIALSNALVSLDINENVLAIPAVYDFEKVKKEQWIGLRSGVDINFLKTPNLNSFNESTSELFELSLSNGINYGFKKGANEFLIGASFSSKTLDPGLVDALEVPNINPGDAILDPGENIDESEMEVSIYFRSLTLEKYEIVSLPFQYRRHFNHESKFHPYAFGGISTNVVLFTDFKQNDKLATGNARPKFFRDEVAELKPEDFPEGLIEGGHYTDNIFLTLVVGGGIERKFNRAKVFFESQYTTNLFASTLGPRNVQLRTVSFSLGAKYKI